MDCNEKKWKRKGDYFLMANFWSGKYGEFLTDQEITGVTQGSYGNGEDINYCENIFFICETISTSAMRYFTNLLGGNFIEDLHPCVMSEVCYYYDLILFDPRNHNDFDEDVSKLNILWIKLHSGNYLCFNWPNINFYYMVRG